MQTTTLVEGRWFCEGPRWHDERFWFSDFYAHEICSVGLDGDLRTEVALDGDERPSGLGWLPDGRLLFVAMIARRVMRREHDGSIAVHADLSDVATFHCNDMLVDEAGRAYVGNFGFDLDAAMATMGPEGLLGAIAVDRSPYTAVLSRVDPDGSVTVVADDLAFPNGVVTVDGGSTLVVAQTLGLELTAFDKAADGTLSNRRIWASLIGDDGTLVAPDGIAADASGGIWVANPLGPEVVRVEEGGAITHRVTTSTLAFACAVGGPDGRHLLACTAPSSDAEMAGAAALGKLEIVEL
ncbi:MAG TPA: SMP-30/gluconolactonase/LRE family protein [Ilumatobacteraceae bacterium]|nr:SMP-30/gluconolactonase/LRE family protein [Ilumatobacteraceae bacterium]